MKIIELLKNPIIKIIGISLILYFGLFADRKNPRSLGNRLSSENIKKNFNEAKEKGKFIAVNVKSAKKILEQNGDQQKTAETIVEDLTKITSEDLEIGVGDAVISCGDEVKISYGIYDKTQKQLEFVGSEKIIIGSEKDSLIEKKIIGMKLSGVRDVNIPYGFVSKNKKLMRLLEINKSDLKYQITILAFGKAEVPKIIC